MKNKINHRRIIVKFYFSVKGFFKMLSLKNGEKYIGGASNCPSIYRGDRIFYESRTHTDTKYGVTYYSTQNKKYPYWQLGILKWRKNSSITIEN